MSLTLAERSRLVAVYLETRSIKTVKAVSRQEFHKRCVSRATIKRWAKQYQELGHLNAKKRARRVSGLPTPHQELAYSVAGAFEANPSLSLNKASKLFGVNRSFIRRALRRAGMYPCKSVVENENCKAKKAASVASDGAAKEDAEDEDKVLEESETDEVSSDANDSSPCACVMCYVKKGDQQPLAITKSEDAKCQASNGKESPEGKVR